MAKLYLQVVTMVRIARLRSGEVIDQLTGPPALMKLFIGLSPLGPKRYIVANDSRALFVLDIDEQLSGQLLVPFAMDDLEHVTFSCYQ